MNILCSKCPISIRYKEHIIKLMLLNNLQNANNVNIVTKIQIASKKVLKNYSMPQVINITL